MRRTSKDVEMKEYRNEPLGVSGAHCSQEASLLPVLGDDFPRTTGRMCFEKRVERESVWGCDKDLLMYGQKPLR